MSEFVVFFLEQSFVSLKAVENIKIVAKFIRQKYLLFEMVSFGNARPNLNKKLYFWLR